MIPAWGWGVDLFPGNRGKGHKINKASTLPQIIRSVQHLSAYSG
jgi:hypothetical protein